MVHQREHRQRLEIIWLLAMDSWKTYIPPTVLVLLPLTTPGLIAGSGKSVLRCVLPPVEARPNKTYMIDKLRDHPGH